MSKKEITIELSEKEHENLQLIVSRTKDDQMDINEYYRGVFLAGLEWFLAEVNRVAQEFVASENKNEESDESV